MTGLQWLGWAFRHPQGPATSTARSTHRAKRANLVPNTIGLIPLSALSQSASTHVSSSPRIEGRLRIPGRNSGASPRFGFSFSGPVGEKGDERTHRESNDKVPWKNELAQARSQFAGANEPI